MAKAKLKQQEDTKVTFNTTDANLMATLRKHMNDWFENHKGEEFISPMIFQQTYPQFDKYDSIPFLRSFYNIRKKS